MKKFQWLIGALIFFGVLFATLFYYTYQIFLTPNVLVKKKDTFLTIPEGADFDQLMDSLNAKKVLTDKLSFAFLSKLSGYKDNIKPGHYLLKANTTNKEAIWMLRAGTQAPVNITFTSTRDLNSMAESLTRNIRLEPTELMALLTDSSFISEYGFNETTLPAMFLPNTYNVYWDVSAEGLFKRMYKEYERFWSEERKEKARFLGLTPIQVSTLASIVYEETTKNDEMPKIAGVYLNRLRNPNETNKLLQADPTVKYAVGDPGLKRVLKVHTQIDHPYNTYMYPGLPPGPINIPSIQSIKAVLNPSDHEFYYFCARPDFSGYHAFAQNHREHINNRRAYQQFLNREGIF